MKPTINARILMLKNESGLTNLDFCHSANISHGTLNNIQNGENVSPKTIQAICKALNINKEWLVSGTGEKFGSDTKEEKSTIDKALELLEDQLKKKDEQIATLLNVVSKLNFLEALSENNGGPGKRTALRPAA